MIQKYLRHSFITCLLAAVFIPLQIMADSDSSFERKMLKAGESLSDRIDKAAEKIDLYLAGEKYTDRVNDTSVTFSQLMGISEGGKQRMSSDFGVNLRLPNLEKRWQLRFTTYDEEEEARDLQQRRIRIRARERDYGAGLFFLRKLGKVKVTYQPRLELRDPLEVSHMLRLESVAEMKPVRLAPTLRLFADPEKGTGIFGALEFVTELSKYSAFSVQNEAEYRERGNLFLSQHGLGIDYAVSDNQGIGLSGIAGLLNRPSYHLDSITVAPSFAHELYYKRLKYIVTPYLAFIKAAHFKGNAGLSFTLELIF